jgi:hypothetical protein
VCGIEDGVSKALVVVLAYTAVRVGEILRDPVDGSGRISSLVYLWHCQEQLTVEPVLWRATDYEGYHTLFDSEVDVPTPDGSGEQS